MQSTYEKVVKLKDAHFICPIPDLLIFVLRFEAEMGVPAEAVLTCT
jgi:hypothetical protein